MGDSTLSNEHSRGGSNMRYSSGDGYRRDGPMPSHRRPPRFPQDDNRRAKRPRWSEGDSWTGGDGDDDRRGGRGGYFSRRGDYRDGDRRSPSPSHGRREGRRSYGGDDKIDEPPRYSSSGRYSGGDGVSSSNSGRRRDPLLPSSAVTRRPTSRIVRSAAAAHLDSSSSLSRSRPSDDGEPEEGEYLVAAPQKHSGGDGARDPTASTAADSERSR
eukprot:Gregarina_sp_Poly_1__6879@NODE_3729_length_908_cov_89_604043_g947_i2_p1_GENE_NODE_3729_length_908_cov_89_604043_g947_i2NODE_3729_length_908_cov_89_604043_g947_i2_p1_ORF_typecomplete_len214_score42_47_NODE_3729_length_908_cov_89_604043_g947_i290731